MTSLASTLPAGERRTRRPAALIEGMMQAAFVAAIFTALASQPSGAAERVKIAVFDFGLKDTSAVVSHDAIDTGYLRDATEEARSRLSASGRYNVVDTGRVADEVAAAGGVLNCDGCDGRLADRLGADQSLVGYVTRVSRTEYTISLLVRDAQTGEVISRGFTGLRLGANYAWPRGVSWLMDRWVPEAQASE